MREGKIGGRAKTIQPLAARRCVVGVPWREREGEGRARIRGTGRPLGGPAASGPAEGEGPVVQPGVEGASYQALMLGDRQDGGEHVGVGQADMAARHREVGRDPCVLSLRECHTPEDAIITLISVSRP